MTPEARVVLHCCRAQNDRHFRELTERLRELDVLREHLCADLRRARDLRDMCDQALAGIKLRRVSNRRDPSSRESRKAASSGNGASASALAVLGT